MAGNLLNQLFQRREPGFWRPIQPCSWYMHRLSLSHRRGTTDYADRRCDERWSSVFCEEKKISLSLSEWQKALHLADEASPWPRALNPHTQTRLLSLKGRRTQSEGVWWRRGTWAGDNREKMDAAEGKQMKDKVEWRASSFSVCNYSTVKSSPKVGFFQLLLNCTFI